MIYGILEEMLTSCTRLNMANIVYMIYGILASTLIMSIFIDLKQNKYYTTIIIVIMLIIIALFLFHIIIPCPDTLFFIEIASGVFISFIIIYHESRRNSDMVKRDNKINEKTINIFKIILKNLRREKILLSKFYNLDSIYSDNVTTGEEITNMKNQHKINAEYAKNLILISNNTLESEQISESIKICMDAMLNYDLGKIDMDIGTVSEQIQNLERMLIHTFQVNASDIDEEMLKHIR